MTIDVADVIVAWAKQAVKDQPLFDWVESRPFPLYWPTPARRIQDDCGATVDLYFFMAGAADPMGNGYDGAGNTETLWAAAEAAGQLFREPTSTKPADLVIYYEGEPSAGATVHTALIVEGGTDDPLTVSHGQESEPAFVNVSQDGRPHMYARFPTIAVNRISVPPGYGAIPGTAASRIPAKFRPAPTPPPTLKLGDTQPRAWIVYLRRLLEQAIVPPFHRGCGPVLGRFVPSPVPGGYGELTHAAVKRFEERSHMSPDGIATARVWEALGVV